MYSPLLLDLAHAHAAEVAQRAAERHLAQAARERARARRPRRPRHAGNREPILDVPPATGTREETEGEEADVGRGSGPGVGSGRMR